MQTIPRQRHDTIPCNNPSKRNQTNQQQKRMVQRPNRIQYKSRIRLLRAQMAKTTKRRSETMKSGVNIDCNYVVKVKDLMDQLEPIPLLPTILVTGWNEWLQVITVETGI